ncbi:acyl-CoA dehydrogenase C-terminal domain-containing protein [Oceanicoccus sp. KOV_DT_Chl]|uniref:acyl-CoA dehydrogenase C-terminal domain-containing protein n=1 Tax=Oceanicoccus sp. KOV_DT_Chl TaxID=1904639 RepID=UPI000C7DBD88|nr:acyl-CoA dehydrogenase C-terminal domain-containing protein [Oceanicoccus sp. KOV_DT_Chl]
MAVYKTPLRDMQFVMNDVLDCNLHYQNIGAEDTTPEIVETVLEAAAKFIENEVVPLYRSADEQGCRWDNGQVVTPDGFITAYQQFIANGWMGLSQPVEYGGQGLPFSLNYAVQEILLAGNPAFSTYPIALWGAISTVCAHASEELVERYVPSMVSGAWGGTMCLTESHCGSDLGLLKTKAEPDGDDSYRITGTKIFITTGEHDMVENIVHIVLARLPDAPSGVKGISLFMVPKINVNDDGSLGSPNKVACGSIEHKMGLNGSATCVMNFDGAKGYLIGVPNQGLNAMFTFINESRMAVAQQGPATMERAYQGALAYAKERLQMRAPVRKLPDQPADPILVHPDVRRMLLTQKALAEGGRLMTFQCAQLLDVVKDSVKPDDVALAEKRLALLTPIAKGFLSELGQEAAALGVQVFGGHGYIREWGMEQIIRDARIATIYEGTTGIQGLDLLGRKVLAGEGALLNLQVEEMRECCLRCADTPRLQYFTSILNSKIQDWLQLTAKIAEKSHDSNEINAAGVDYLMFSGYTLMAYCWLLMAEAAQQAIDRGDESGFYHSKLKTARFYYERILPRTLSHAQAALSGAEGLMAFEDEDFCAE